MPTPSRAVAPRALFTLLFLIPALAPAQDADLAERIETWLQPAIDDGTASGCLLVVDEGEVVYENCFGEANAEWDLPNTPDTRFGIASITKPLQLILAARMADDGLLALEDPISKWLPDFPKADSTLVLDLANHTAGIPHRVTTPEQECDVRTAADMVELVKEEGLDLDLRGERSYSSAGYSVFARVLELAGDDSWDRLMQRHVFDPAGMEHTIHPSDRRLIPRRATSYAWTFSGLEQTQPKDLSFLVGAGSLYSTPRDLWRVVETLLDGGYGSTAQEWAIRDRDSFDWNGRTNGYRAFCDVDVAARRAVIYCANVSSGAADRIRGGVPTMLDGGEAEPIPSLSDLGVVEVDTETLRQFEGRYALRENTILDVRARDGSIWANEWELVPLGGTRFFSLRDANHVIFVRGDDGAIERMDWGGGEEPYRIPRVGDREE